MLEVFHQKGLSLVNHLDFDLSSGNLEEEIKSYVKNYLKRHGQIKVLNMREPVHLEEIYAGAELLLGAQDATGLQSTEELDKAFAKVGDLLSINRDKYKRTPALDFVEENPRLVVLGGPGAGKSTLLKKVGIEVWRRSGNSRKRQLLPVFLELKGFSEYERIDIKEQIIKEVRICGFRRNVENFVDRLLENGRLLVILDGLDELAKEKRLETINAIQNFSDQYNENRFLVSCRIAAYQFRRLKNFKDVEIANFEDNQIYTAISNWFSENKKISNNCWVKLNSQENKSVKKLANTPLLLTLICIYYQQTGNFPVNKPALYEKAISVLLEEWNVSKGSWERYESLDSRQKEFFLETLAYEAFEESKVFMYQRWMGRRIEELLADMELTIDMRGEEIIKTIELDNGILVKQAEQVYSFSHATIQEYFCAQFITKRFSRINENIEKHILDERWQGIFLFLSGSKQSEDVLDAIEKKAKTYTESVSIMWLLSWATKNTIASTGNLLPVVRRVFAVHIALCLHLYLSATDKRFGNVLGAIRMCQSLIKEFDDDIPRSLRQDLREFEKLIAGLITTRQNSNAYNASFKSLTGRRVKVKDMEKQVESVCRQCSKATSILSKNRIFRNVKTNKINENCQDIGRRTSHLKESPDKYLNFCNQFVAEWMSALNLDLRELEKLNSQLINKFCNHLYCLCVLKQCGDTAKLFSLQQWDLQKNRMLFSTWVSPDNDPWQRG